MSDDVLHDMTDEQFSDAVMQAFKRREAFPEWWRAVLTVDLIDATQGVVEDALGRCEEQARNPERYPHAASFATKLRRNALPEIALARACMRSE